MGFTFHAFFSAQLSLESRGWNSPACLYAQLGRRVRGGFGPSRAAWRLVIVLNCRLCHGDGVYRMVMMLEMGEKGFQRLQTRSRVEFVDVAVFCCVLARQPVC
jgi:hypothetical protein